MALEDTDFKGPDILKKIQQVESEVERMMNDAEMQHQAMVLEAKKIGERMVEDAKKNIEQNRIALLEQETQKGEAEADVIIQKAKRDVQSLKQRTQAKLDEGARVVLEILYPDLFQRQGK